LLGLLYRGFTVPAAKLAVLTGAEIFGRHRVARRIKGSKLDEAQALRHARDMVRDLRERDLVVHMEHGIGRFIGVSSCAMAKEVMVLRYADDAKLYVPTAQAHLVSRYVGVGGKSPMLDNFGDPKWARTRERRAKRGGVRRADAERGCGASGGPRYRACAGHQMAGGVRGQLYLSQTPDQLRSVERSSATWKASAPWTGFSARMSGFGKTEVAIRAAFKAVMGGRQVAILAPTTVLRGAAFADAARAHERVPVTVEMMCRLTPPDKEREICKACAMARWTLSVGTHRLLSKDVQFKNLGLAVVDEEQRFGVKHKERFKEMFRLIDVLTLSATPIPRTLYLVADGHEGHEHASTRAPPNRHAGADHDLSV